MPSIYKHLAYTLDTYPFIKPIIEKIEHSTTVADRRKYRDLYKQTIEDIDNWFIKFGYTCGDDYFVSDNYCYKIANPAIATVFNLTFTK